MGRHDLPTAEAKAVEASSDGLKASTNPQLALQRLWRANASRSALFRHLEGPVRPDANKENTAKLAVVVAYARDAQLGADARNGGPAATAQLVVKPIEHVTGGPGPRACSRRSARREHGEARRRAREYCDCGAAQHPSRRAAHLHYPRRAPARRPARARGTLPERRGGPALAGRLTKRIRRCAHVIARALRRRRCRGRERTTARPCLSWRRGQAGATRRSTRPGSATWHEPCGRAAAGRAVESVAAATPSRGARRRRPRRHAASAVSKLDGRVQGDVVLQAMPWREARAKLAAHKAQGRASRRKPGLRLSARSKCAARVARARRPHGRRRLARRLAARARPRFAQCPNQISASWAVDQPEQSSRRRESLVDSAQAARATRARACSPPGARARAAAPLPRRGGGGLPRRRGRGLARDARRRAQRAGRRARASLEGFALYLAKSDGERLRRRRPSRCAGAHARPARRAPSSWPPRRATPRGSAWRRVIRDIDGGATRNADDAAPRAAAAPGEARSGGAAGGRTRARRRGRRVRPHGAVPRGGRGAERPTINSGRRGSHASGARRLEAQPLHTPRAAQLLGPTPPAWRLMIARDPPAPTATTRPPRPRPPRRRQRRRRRRRGGADEVAAFLELARTCVEIELQAPTPSS